MADKSFCLDAKLGNPGKNHDSCHYERKDRKQRFPPGKSTGRELLPADKISNHLRQAGPQGVAKTDLHALLGRNQTAAEINQALETLQSEGMAVPIPQEESGGRPREVWRATGGFLPRVTPGGAGT